VPLKYRYEVAYMKNILICLAIIILLLILPPLLGKIHNANYSEKDYSFFYQEMTAKKIKSVIIKGEALEGEYLNGRKFKLSIPAEASWDLVKDLNQNGVSVKIEKSFSSNTSVYLYSWLPLVYNISFLIALIFLIIAITRLLHKRSAS
jgi:ATP-dependent Zn protease